MDVIAETAATANVFELLRVVWMEVAMASFAATLYFTFSGWLTPRKKTKAVTNRDSAQRSPRGQEANTLQMATKALRQGKINTGVALIKQLPEAACGRLPTNIAPRLLMAAAKSPNFDEALRELNTFANKIEGRSFDAVVLEAMRNRDSAACRQLFAMSQALGIPRSLEAMEALAKVQGADAAYLQKLMQECSMPLPLSFAKAVLEACAALKDTDLAAEVFEKVSESDTPVLREVVEKAAIAASTATEAKVPNEASIHGKEIRTLGKKGDVEGAAKVFNEHIDQCCTALMFNSIMDACVECGDSDRSLMYFEMACAKGCADVVTHNMAMKVHVSKGEVEVAQQLFSGLRKKNLNPTIASYHIMLNFHASAGDRASAWNLVAEMQAAAIVPTTTTCAIMLKGKPNSADIDKVLALADKIESMDEVFFHSLAEACVHTGQLHILTKYHAKLTSGNSTVLTAPTYGSMIKAFGQAHDLKRVWDLWGDMLKKNVQPTAITLGCMIEALVANKRISPAWELVQQMRKEDATRPLVNTVIYSTILKGFAYAKETDKVMSLYEEMKANDIQPNNITYNTILNAFAQGGAMHRVPALLEDMKKAVPPAEPDLVTFSTIVKGYCNSGSLERALQVVEDMRLEGKLVPDEVMYNSLLDGCAKEQRPSEAMKLLDDMRKTGVRPSNYTLSMLVKLMGRCKRLNQAFSIIEDLSKEYGLKVNIQVYTCLIQACFNSRQAGRAVALHDQIIAEGLIPDEMTYSVLVQGALRAGLVEKAVYLAKCAYGLGGTKFRGSPPGIKSNNLDDLISALGGPKGKDALKLLDDIAEAQMATAPAKGKGKGNSKGRASTPPWQKN
jgi:pentatricopeptide repeat protein